MKASPPLVCALPDKVCIEVRGPDAEAFLRAQLSRDPPPPGAGGCVPAAWLDARGRVRALFLSAAVEQGYLLLAEAETAQPIAAKLRMFVLRARVTVAVSDALRVVALVGPGAGDAAAGGLGRGGDGGRDGGSGEVLRLPLGPGLVAVVGPEAPLAAAVGGLERGAPELAALAEIRLGLPRIGAAVLERYVPQMLNLDLLEAVSFDKGCYPGQEVVARLKYRGEVKRRMQRFACRTPGVLPAPADEIAEAGGAVVGEVVQAAPGEGGVELLAVVGVDAQTPLRLAALPAATLERLPLPYERAVSPRA